MFGYPYQPGIYGASPFGGGGGFVMGPSSLQAYGGFGGGGVMYAPHRSHLAMMPYDRSDIGYNNCVDGWWPDQNHGLTAQQSYHKYHAMAKHEEDPVYRTCLRVGSDAAYQAWKGQGSIDQGHYQCTLNTAFGADKAFQNGW